ncbi:hypothetical protein [Streptomyces celluloflavus]|uniref:hypothetical protein n=1 Tax=Streptomyces celluloflavus TaxID=58344 RepID=UPI0036A04B87
MPSKGEPARRRYGKLVDRLESSVRASRKPKDEGHYGQLILSGNGLEEMGELRDIRRAAREAGTRLGRTTTTRLVCGRLFVLDERQMPEEIERLAGDTTAAAMGQAFREDR